MVKVGIIGATGYVGQQLVGLLSRHKECQISFVSSNSYVGESFADIYGQYHGQVSMECVDTDKISENLSKVDLVFIALPHGLAFETAKLCRECNVKVIDMGADFRLKDGDIYKEWYKLDHRALDLNKEAVYGLPEVYYKEIKEADIVGNPGCFPTASILSLIPLLKTDLIDKSSIIIDAKSGVSGAGRSAKVDNLFSEVNESLKAYGVAGHRHTPEIEQELSNISNENVTLSFTPHLVPMNRGILATSYASLKMSISEKEIYDLYREEYKDAPFVRVIDDLPQTRWVRGSNFCDIGIRVDKRTNRVIILSAIDNMMKGAAGQGVQNMNIMFGIDEKTGLGMLPMLP
jgi:N-acetyl-gamma-glutamyl-phosphate reductase